MKFVYLSPSVRTEMQALKNEIVLSMNGVVAESLQKQGLLYKQNYGVVVSRLCEIARHHTQNALLAEALWLSGEREFMLLACMLQPQEKFTRQDAQKWMKLVNNAELAEQLSFRLLSRLPFAVDIAREAIKEVDEWQQLVALYILPRIAHELNEVQTRSFLTYIFALMDTPHNLMFHAAANALQHFCDVLPLVVAECSTQLQIEHHPERLDYIRSIIEPI